MFDLCELDRAAIAAMQQRLATLTVADLDRPTATTDWDVRTLLAHLVGGNLRFAQALRGELPDWPTRDLEPITSPTTEFDASAAVMGDAVAGLTDPKRPVRLPAAEPPGWFAVGVHGADMLIHGWDLDVTLGHRPALDPELCAAAITVLDRYPSSFWGPGQFFADRVPTTSTDPAQRLLALSGRDPNRAAGLPAHPTS